MLVNKTGIFLLVLFVTGFNSFAQEDYCQENATGVFWPIEINVKQFYHTTTIGYTSYFNGDTIVSNGKVYYKRVEEYNGKPPEIKYLREENGNTYLKKDDTETLELSNNTTPGYIWFSTDSLWSYTVIDTISKAITPYCSYTGLLNIKAEPKGKLKKEYSSYYNLYFKRGVGLVQLSIEDKGYSFLGIDPDLITEVGMAAVGCENIVEPSERKTCTNGKINQAINEEFGNLRKMKKGLFRVTVVVNEQGDVADIEISSGIKNAEIQESLIIKAIKRIKFIPRSINGKPKRSLFILPVKF